MITKRILNSSLIYRATLSQFSPPNPLGIRIKENLHTDTRPILCAGWHGSDLSYWKTQIEAGKVQVGRDDFYFGSMDLAAVYSAQHKTPILLFVQIYGGVVNVHPTFGTLFVDHAYPSEVVIQNAHHLSDAYLKHYEDPKKPKLLQKHVIASKMALQSLLFA